MNEWAHCDERMKVFLLVFASLLSSAHLELNMAVFV